MIEEVRLLDHGYAKFIESWGSDERIIESARMSTDGAFRGWGGGECDCVSAIDMVVLGDPKCKKCGGTGIVVGDEKLLKYLYDSRHTSPFEMGGMTVEIQAPIMVFREWHRHRTQSYNEMSGRYVQMPNLHYVPNPDRVKAQSASNKQGSGGNLPKDVVDDFLKETAHIQKLIYDHYEKALKNGIAREIARINTPVSRYSRMRASANLRNWLGFISLRSASDAQWEIQEYSNAVLGFISDKFPRTATLFKK
jgi:thymidylate synthase (FAD)